MSQRMRRASAVPVGLVAASLAKVRIYDCFIFNDELDLLEIRLEELDQHVDQFVLVESRETFGGDSKPLHFHENRGRYARFLPKIRHVIVDHVPAVEKQPNPSNPARRISEFYQRRMMVRGIEDARDCDVVLVSDVDEIPRGRLLGRHAWAVVAAGGPVIFKQDWRLCYFNAGVVDSDRPRTDAADGNFCWFGTMACTGRFLRESLDRDTNRLWSIKWGQTNCLKLSNAGWHFSWIGGADAILGKIHAVAGRVYGESDWRALASKKFNGLRFEFTSRMDGYPAYLLANRDRYQAFFGSDTELRDLIARIEHSAAGSKSASMGVGTPLE